MKGRGGILPFLYKMTEKIILFTRVPKEGTTKTRLYNFIQPKQAVEIQIKLLKKKLWFIS